MAKKRKRTQIQYTPGKKLKKQNFRRSPSFFGIMLALAFFAFIYLYNREDLDILTVSGDFNVHYIDVGQGDSILIQNKDNEFMLIDTGEGDQYTKLSNYLKHCGVNELKYAIFTHPHTDHIGSAYKIVQQYPIDKLIMPSAFNNTSAFTNLIEEAENKNIGITRAEPGKTYQFGEAEFIILAPLSEKYENLNNYSVVILMKYGNTKFLFTGDMERESENEVMNYCVENNFDISADVLKVAHHGSQSSSQVKFLDLIKPKIAVIQVGEGNSYNHPNPLIIERLENTGSEILRNDIYGDIIVSSDGRDLTVQVNKGGYSGKFNIVENNQDETAAD